MTTPMRDTLRMEAVRLRTVRSTGVLSVAAVGVTALLAVLMALVSPMGPLDEVSTTVALTAGAPLAPMALVGLLFGVLGVLQVGHDYRFGLARAVLMAQPRRSRVMVARLGVLAAVSAGVALLGVIVGAGLCWLLGRPGAIDLVTARVVVGYLLVVVLWSWLGAGLTWVVRSSAGALVVLLLLPLLVEPALTLAAEADRLAFVRPAAAWLPFGAAREALSVDLLPVGDALGALLGVGVFAGFTAVVLALGWLSLARRDA